MVLATPLLASAKASQAPNCNFTMSIFTRLKSSLTARLLAVYLVTAMVLLAIILVSLLHGFARQWQDNARPHLEQYLDFINEEIGNPPSPDKARQLANRLPVNIYIVGPNIQFSTNGASLDVDNEPFEDAKRGGRHRYPSIGEGKVQFSGNEDRTLLKSTVGEYQVYYELQHNHRRKHRRSIVLPALLGVLGALTLCFLVIRRLLRPVRDIRDGVIRMGQGDLTHTIPVRSKNDLGELAGSINTMASDINQMLDAKRQLLLGASHELRSPLTRAKVATQLLDESKQRDMIEEDLAEMEALIAGILESERMKSGHAQLNRTQVDIKQLLASVVQDMRVDNIRIECANTVPMLYADEVRLTILLRNLIGNAVNHSAPGSGELIETADENKVVVSVEQHADYLQLTVKDSGPGIAPEHILKVTEPFYRTDASRTRSTGGFGLGLYLSKLIAEAHGGKLQIHSNTAHTAVLPDTPGTTITVQLPLTVQA